MREVQLYTCIKMSRNSFGCWLFKSVWYLTTWNIFCLPRNIYFSIYQIPLKHNKFAWKENIPFPCTLVADSSLFLGSAFPSSPWHRSRLRAPTRCQPDLTHKTQRWESVRTICSEPRSQSVSGTAFTSLPLSHILARWAGRDNQGKETPRRNLWPGLSFTQTSRLSLAAEKDVLNLFCATKSYV